jgi:hypothetical protein
VRTQIANFTRGKYGSMNIELREDQYQIGAEETSDGPDLYALMLRQLATENRNANRR